MTRDDIIRMVQESRLGDLLADGVIHDYELVNFAALVAAAEREECARIVEEMHWCSDAYHAIRARGENK